MIATNKSGWTLLEYLNIREDEITDFDPVTGSYAIIQVNGKYLIGYNPYREQWEFPAGGIEPGETARDAAARELLEETHQTVHDLEFRGLVKIRKPNGDMKYQAVFLGSLDELTPFETSTGDEMDKLMLWDLKEPIGYVDECDVKIVQLSCLQANG